MKQFKVMVLDGITAQEVTSENEKFTIGQNGWAKPFPNRKIYEIDMEETAIHSMGASILKTMKPIQSLPRIIRNAELLPSGKIKLIGSIIDKSQLHVNH